MTVHKSLRGAAAALLLATLLWGPSAVAGNAQTIEDREVADPAAGADAAGARMAAAFLSWATAWEVPVASFSARRGTRTIAEAAVGFRSPTTRTLVGSLSKAVTGVCVAKLVETKQLAYGRKLGAIIPGWFKANGSVDPRAKSITIAQLLTHSSGMAFDPTQSDDAAIDPTRKSYGLQLAAALTKPLAAKTFAYNNVNYTALAMVIEQVTGRDYETYCATTVLKPVGVTAGVAEDWRVFGPYGGWRLSVRDYAAFLDHFRPASGLLASSLKDWPKAKITDGYAYSLGVVTSTGTAKAMLMHDGAIQAQLPGIGVDVGAMFRMYGGDLRLVVGYQPLPSDAAIADLDARMLAAARP